MREQFDKKKCSKCKYHGYIGYKSDAPATNYNHVMCDYAKYTKTTCLRSSGKSVIDLRGDDPDHCKLFIKGVRPEDMRSDKTFNSKGVKNDVEEH